MSKVIALANQKGGIASPFQLLKAYEDIQDGDTDVNASGGSIKRRYEHLYI